MRSGVVPRADASGGARSGRIKSQKRNGSLAIQRACDVNDGQMKHKVRAAGSGFSSLYPRTCTCACADRPPKLRPPGSLVRRTAGTNHVLRSRVTSMLRVSYFKSNLSCLLAGSPRPPFGDLPLQQAIPLLFSLCFFADEDCRGQCSRGMEFCGFRFLVKCLGSWIR